MPTHRCTRVQRRPPRPHAPGGVAVFEARSVRGWEPQAVACRCRPGPETSRRMGRTVGWGGRSSVLVSVSVGEEESSEPHVSSVLLVLRAAAAHEHHVQREQGHPR